MADAVRPSWNETVSEPPSAASATTWLLVRMTPSLLRTMPDPVPLPAWPVNAIETTLGRTFAETASMEVPSEALLIVPLSVEDAAVVGLSWLAVAAAPTAPPTPPASSAVTRTAAVVRPSPPRRSRVTVGVAVGVVVGVAVGASAAGGATGGR